MTVLGLGVCAKAGEFGSKATPDIAKVDSEIETKSIAVLWSLPFKKGRPVCLM